MNSNKGLSLRLFFFKACLHNDVISMAFLLPPRFFFYSNLRKKNTIKQFTATSNPWIYWKKFQLFKNDLPFRIKHLQKHINQI